MRVVFMGTPEFAVPSLKAVLGAFEVVGVYTQPDKPVGRGLEVQASPVKNLALEHGIPVFQPAKLSAPGEFEKLAELKPDVIVVVAFGQILRRNVLDLPRLGCVNVHSSLLPRWRGAAPIQWAVLTGDARSGVTTQKMAEKLDAGDILLQASTPLSADETASTLHDRLSQMGAELIVATLNGLADGSVEGRTQDESAVTLASKLSKEMECLEPAKQSALEMDRRVRALNPWPGTSVRLGGQRLKIRGARLRADLSVSAGTVEDRHGMLLLGGTSGALELTRVQWDGKAAVDAGAFANGLAGRGMKFPLRVDG